MTFQQGLQVRAPTKEDMYIMLDKQKTVAEGEINWYDCEFNINDIR